MSDIKSPIKLYNLVLQHLDAIEYNNKKVDVYNYSVDDFKPILFRELLVNTRLILENQKNNNFNSMGVDVCARVIIEICTLLFAAKTNRFTDEQKKLFLLDYFGLEYSKLAQKDVPEELREHLSKPYNKIIDEYISILGCSREDAIKIAEERRPFLKYGGKRQYPSFLAFVLSIQGEEMVECRELINFFIHPSFTGFQRQKNGRDNSLASQREKTINQVLNLASKHIPEIESKEYVKSKWKDDYIDADTQKTITRIKKYFKQAYKDPFKTNDSVEYWKESILENRRTRSVVFNCIERVECTLIDIFICESLNYKTQAMARMKAILEMISLLGRLFEDENIDYLASDFADSSLLSVTIKHHLLFHIIKKYDKGETLDDKEQEVFDTYLKLIDDFYESYKEGHQTSLTLLEFEKEARIRPLYFLSDNPNYKYSTLFREVIKDYIPDKRTNNEITNDYLWSSILGHASAYNSEMRLNKSYKYIPNLLTYLIRVLKAIDVTPTTGDLIYYLEELVSEVSDDNRTKYDEEMFSKYKKIN